MYFGRSPNSYNRNVYRYDIGTTQSSVSGVASAGGTMQYLPGPTTLIFLNGTLLVETIDYTATDGTTVSFTSSLGAGDSVTVIAENALNIAGSYTFAQSDSRYLSSTVSETSIASATTTDIGASPTENVLITGTTGITSLGSGTNKRRRIRLSSTVTITPNGSTLVHPNNLPIFGLAGDILTYESDSSGNWRLVQFMSSLGRPLSQFGTSVRQTTVQGSVDSTGAPNWIPATSASLTLTTQNISASSPLIFTAAMGYGASGAIDRISMSTANLAWSLSASGSFYLFVALNANGTITTGSATLAPIYQRGGTIAVTSGQYTYDIEAMIMYLGNGSTASPVQVLFVGEAVTGVGTVTSTVTYAHRGQFVYTDTNSLPGASTATTFNHNIGVTDVNAIIQAANVVTQAGFTLGSVVTAGLSCQYGASPVTWSAMATVISTRNTGYFSCGSQAAFAAQPNTGGSPSSLTGSSWRYRVVANRTW
jgi:hypothetical protein